MGEFANPFWIKILAWAAAGLIIVLNGILLYYSIRNWTGSSR
jgi:Mn2+/Fe2+ NRAMP family transporter